MYYVYLLTNQRNTVIYTGVTNDILRRLSEHRNNNRHHFAQKYQCGKLVYFEEFTMILDAIKREKQIKAGSRLKKEILINKMNPLWKDISGLLSGLPRRAKIRSSQ